MLSKPVFWPSKKAMRLFQSTDAINSFSRIAPYFQPQLDSRTCGIASAAIVMQSLRPKRTPYSQWDVLNSATDAIKSRRAMLSHKNPGVSLAQLAAIIATHGLQVHQKTVSKQASLTMFRRDLARTLASPNSRIICNFDRSKIGLNHKGHFCPLAAYNKQNDAVLVLEVAIHCNAWFWIGAEALFKSMQTKDGLDYRGYLLVKRESTKRPTSNATIAK